MKFNMNKNIASVMLGGLIMAGAVGCTDKFEDFNTDPMAPTPEQMEGDFYNTAGNLATAIPAIVLGQENDYQMLDQMIGCEYGHMTSARNHWGGDRYYATFNVGPNWSGNMFDTTMPKMYTPFFQIRKLAGTESLVYFWADLIRVFGSLRVSDCYGPIPFSKIGNGTDFAVAYDDMPTLYDALFAELDVCIAGLKQSVGSSTTQQLFGSTDYVYGGDIAKWVKLANTLKLRMALRLVNVKPELARAKAEEAVNDPAGLISDPSESAWSTFIPGGNSFNKVNILWGEGRISADLVSYMGGYNDPRLAVYASKDANDGFSGLRSGIFHVAAEPAKVISAPRANCYVNAPDNAEQAKLLCISASESWFARAEGALRGWNMGGTAKELYEKGVEVSMAERGASIGDYLTSTATPANHVSLLNASYNISAVSTITPKYDEADGFEKNLERILVQKWIGNYPNGWETWADFRRTGYPKFFPAVNNLSTDGVSSARGARRLPFPQSEFNTNEANVKAAQAMLGGPDNMATDLWWAKKD